jgi:hypothetical protein
MRFILIFLFIISTVTGEFKEFLLADNRIIILGLEALSDPTTSLLEVGGDIHVLLFPSNLCFHPASGL